MLKLALPIMLAVTAGVSVVVQQALNADSIDGIMNNARIIATEGNPEDLETGAVMQLDELGDQIGGCVSVEIGREVSKANAAVTGRGRGWGAGHGGLRRYRNSIRDIAGSAFEMQRGIVA